MELREKIAALVGDAFVTCGSYKVEEQDALETADAILAIPEIRDALEAYKPIYIFGDFTEETRNWPGKPDGVRHRKPPTTQQD